jgi:hypothetical protein
MLLSSLSNQSWHYADIRQISVLFGIIHSIAHYKLVGNRKPHIVGFDRLLSSGRLVEQRCDPEGFREPGLQNIL